MRGDLVERTAADLCRDLAASTATGVLAVDGPDGPARLVVADGRIIAATSPAPSARLGDRLIGAGELDPGDLAEALRFQEHHGTDQRLATLLVERGLVHPDAVRLFAQEQVLDALFQIICWRYGAYAFTPADDPAATAAGAPAATGAPVSLAIDDALVEVARRQQEWRQLSKVIPDVEAVPSLRQDAASAASLETDEVTVLSNVDGERSIRALATDLGYGEFETARVVYGLSLLDIVEVRLPQDAIGAALEDALAVGPVDRSIEAPTNGQHAPTEEHEPASSVEEPERVSPEEPEPASPAAEHDPASLPDEPDLEETRPAQLFAALYGDPPLASADKPGEPNEDDRDDPRAPQRGDDNDVSEFLRELSRLSVDRPKRSTPPRGERPADPPPPPPDPGPGSGSSSSSSRKKKRGMFGRG